MGSLLKELAIGLRVGFTSPSISSFSQMQAAVLHSEAADAAEAELESCGDESLIGSGEAEAETASRDTRRRNWFMVAEEKETMMSLVSIVTGSNLCCAMVVNCQII